MQSAAQSDELDVDLCAIDLRPTAGVADLVPLGTPGEHLLSSEHLMSAFWAAGGLLSLERHVQFLWHGLLLKQNGNS